MQCLVSLGLLFVLSNPATAQRGRKSDILDLLGPAIIGATIGESIERVAADAQRFVAATQEGTKELQQLREAFWQEYPDGPNFAKADADFGRALFAKDLYYVPLYIMGGERDPVTRGFMKMGPVDGGIRPPALPAYLEWIAELREKIAEPGTSGRVLTLTALLTALPVAALAESPKYRAYRQARDWAETALVGRTPNVDPATYVKMLFRQYGAQFNERPGRTEELATYVSDRMVKDLGEERLRKAVVAVQLAAKDKNGYITDEGLAELQFMPRLTSPDGINCAEWQKRLHAQGSGRACDEPLLREVQAVVPPGWGVVGSTPLALLDAVVARDHVPTYVRRIILNDQDFDDVGSLQADTRYRRYVLAYGEQDVLEVGAALRKAPVRRYGAIVDTTAMGYPATDVAPEMAFAGILAARNPKGAARAWIAFSLGWESRITPQHLDQEYARLAAIKGEQALLDAATRLAKEVSPVPRFRIRPTYGDAFAGYDGLERLVRTGSLDPLPSSPSAAVANAAANPEPAARRPLRGPDVIYIATPPDVVEAMLKLANVTASDVVYDLGSGDGRIPIAAAQKYGAKGVGIEIDPRLVKEANANLSKTNVTEKVKFLNEDLFEADFKDASVVTLFLLPSLNAKLIHKLKTLKPGTRIVSHSFDMGSGWPPDKSERIGSSTIHLWTIR
jgi:hypothetical protein